MIDRQLNRGTDRDTDLAIFSSPNFQNFSSVSDSSAKNLGRHEGWEGGGLIFIINLVNLMKQEEALH